MNKEYGTSNAFLKLFRFETKRYFSNIALLIIACAVPIFLISTLLGSLLPFLFRGAELNNIYIALFNEDKTFETDMIIRNLTESKSVEDFVEILDVDSIEEGRKMLADKEASALIYIPKDLQANLYEGNSQKLYFYAGEKDKQVIILLYDMLKGGIKNINQGQRSVDIVYYSMRDMGYGYESASAEYSQMAQDIFSKIISRSKIYRDYDEVSATGDYLNIEYYTISTMLLCMFLISLSLAANISSDRTTGILDRGGFYRNSFGYIGAKTMAGMLFLLLPMALCTLFILLVSNSFGLFSGNTILILLSLIISALYFSVFMITLGSYAKSTTAAIWAGFSIVLIVSTISGIFIPRNIMPRFVGYAAEFTALPSIIRMLGYSLFGVRSQSIVLDVLKSLSFTAVVFGLGYYKTKMQLRIR
ncbi:MAG: ABC transporter permease [Eubacteriales bacterium]